MALIVQHFKQNKIPKVYLYSDLNVYIEKGGEKYEDAIDLEGQEVYYTETDEHIPGKPYPPEPEPETEPEPEPEPEGESE